jgi:hypothetical protein
VCDRELVLGQVGWSRGEAVEQDRGARLDGSADRVEVLGGLWIPTEVVDLKTLLGLKQVFAAPPQSWPVVGLWKQFGHWDGPKYEVCGCGEFFVRSKAR